MALIQTSRVQYSNNNNNYYSNCSNNSSIPEQTNLIFNDVVIHNEFVVPHCKLYREFTIRMLGAFKSIDGLPAPCLGCGACVYTMFVRDDGIHYSLTRPCRMYADEMTSIYRCRVLYAYTDDAGCTVDTSTRRSVDGLHIKAPTQFFIAFETEQSRQQTNCLVPIRYHGVYPVARVAQQPAIPDPVVQQQVYPVARIDQPKARCGMRMCHAKPMAGSVSMWSVLVLVLSVVYLLYTKTSLSATARDTYYNDRQADVDSLTQTYRSFLEESVMLQIPTASDIQAKKELLAKIVNQDSKCLSDVSKKNATCIADATQFFVTKLGSCDTTKASSGPCITKANAILTEMKSLCTWQADQDVQHCYPKDVLMQTYHLLEVIAANASYDTSKKMDFKTAFDDTWNFMNNPDVRFRGHMEGMWTVVIETLKRMCVEDTLRDAWNVHRQCTEGLGKLFDLFVRHATLEHQKEISDLEYKYNKAKCSSGDTCREYMWDILATYRSCDRQHRKEDHCQDKLDGEMLSMLICKADIPAECDNNAHTTYSWFHGAQSSIKDELTALEVESKALSEKLRGLVADHERIMSKLM